MATRPVEKGQRIKNIKKLNRREFLKVAGLGAAALATQDCTSVCRALVRAKHGRPNIIFIMADDLGPEWLSCYGSEEVKTPNLDKLAAGGMQFTSAYSMPQCTPTRVTLLTGQYPFRHGWVNHFDVPRSRQGSGCHLDPKYYISFARILKTAGYVTAAAGKWQVNDFRIQPDAMVKHGFDEYCMWTGAESGNPQHKRQSAKRYWDPYIYTEEGSRTYKGGFGTDIFVDFLIDFIKRHKDKPMLLYYPMCLCHAPFITTPLEPQATGKLERYKAMVRYLDYSIGRLTGALDELGVRSNTILFFSTDNGSPGSITGRMNGRPVKGGKSTLGENGAREPFIINCPALVPAGVLTDALTDFTDMLPTFAELAGAELPRDIVTDGRSIAKLLLGQQNDSDRRWIMAMGGRPTKIVDGRVVPRKEYNNRVVRDKGHKLWVIDGKSAKLFDLLADPAETNNLIDSTDPGAVAARKKLEAVVKSFPARDASPKYDPTPPQPWDRNPARLRAEKKTKKGKNREEK